MPGDVLPTHSLDMRGQNTGPIGFMAHEKKNEKKQDYLDSSSHRLTNFAVWSGESGLSGEFIGTFLPTFLLLQYFSGRTRANGFTAAQLNYQSATVVCLFCLHDRPWLGDV